ASALHRRAPAPRRTARGYHAAHPRAVRRTAERSGRTLGMMDGPPIRVAMWSGPRNISTAMMRSFGARSDTAVVDEPFYAAYLAATGLHHPMREEVIASQPTDWRAVVAGLLGAVPDNKPIYYQKLMTHHMIESFGRDWLSSVRNAFLIRDPA